jgi:hypothetical protein
LATPLCRKAADQLRAPSQARGALRPTRPTGGSWHSGEMNFRRPGHRPT